MVFLQAHGAGPQLATRIFQKYGPKAVSIVSGDPYRLAIDVWGIGFRTADRIAGSLGIARDSLIRMQAALLQALRDATDSGGSCYVVTEDLETRGAPPAGRRCRRGRRAESGRAGPASARRSRRSCEGGYVVAERAGTLEGARPDDLRGAAIYGVEMHATRNRGSPRGSPNSRSRKAAHLPGFAEAIALFEKDTGTTLAEEQRLAVEKAARCPLLVVTGGPGVGKTSIVKAILSVFHDHARSSPHALLRRPGAPRSI